jgi:hypothetical protein
MTNTVITVKMQLLALCQRWCMKCSFFILMMAHHDRSIRESVIALAEEMNCTVSRSLLQEHGYINRGRMGKLEGAEVLGYGAYSAQFRMLR